MQKSQREYRAELLEICETAPHTYEWQTKESIWAKPDHQNYRSLLSNNSIMQRSMKLTARRGGAYPDITLHHALRFDGLHCFLTDIDVDSPDWYVLTAAIVEPATCEAERTTTGMGELNRPDVERGEPLVFPGVLTEKYQRQTQGDPMSYSEARYVLVTPKCISLVVGEIVNIGDQPYEAVIAHTLDPYKNEFEVLRRRDN